MTQESEEGEFRFWYGCSLDPNVQSPGCIWSQNSASELMQTILATANMQKHEIQFIRFVPSPHHIPHSFPVHSILMQTMKKNPFSFNYFCATGFEIFIFAVYICIK